MGLDFGIVKRRKGEAYASDAWQDMVWGRNCYEAKDIVLQNISTYDEATCTAELRLGTLNNIVVELAKSLDQYDMGDKDTLCDDNYVKTANFLGQLAIAMAEIATEYEFDGIEYEFQLIDSY